MESQGIIDQNRQVYNKIAGHFSDTRSFLWHDLEPLSSFVKDGDSVLDIGCGNGRLYQLFDKKSIAYTGVDISEELIKIAKEKYPCPPSAVASGTGRQAELQFEVGDMINLPFQDKKFDVIFSLVAFHHLPERSLHIKALQEMKRVLKPGGKIIMLNWNAYSDWVKDKIENSDYEDLGNGLFKVPWKTPKQENLGDRIYYGFTLEELEGLFKEVDLNLEDQYYFRHGEKVGVEQGMNIVSILTTVDI